MSTYSGHLGRVRIGGTSVFGRSKRWSYRESVTKIETTYQGDTKRSYDGVLLDGVIEIEADWDNADVGQSDLRTGLSAGSKVQIELFPSGSFEAGEPVLTGEVLVDGKEIGAELEGKVSAKFTAAGALTEGVVSA